MHPGDLIGSYELEALIARGGMGEVWRARHPTLDRLVAIKVIRGEARHRPSIRDAFMREVKNLSKLHSPQTVQVIDSGLTPAGDPFMVTEYLDGEDLGRRIKRDGSIGLLESLRIGIEVLKSLSEAHAVGIVHRDLKPGNIFLQRVPGVQTERYAVKVLDFGVAKIMPANDDDAESTLWPEAPLKGSPRYMAPEQVQGGRVGPKTDLYAFGGVLYRMLCGEPLFPGGRDTVMEAHISQPPQPLLERAPLLGVPPELDSIISHCLEKDPLSRPTSADDVRADLEALMRRVAQEFAPENTLDGSPAFHIAEHLRTQTPSAAEAKAGVDPGVVAQLFGDEFVADNPGGLLTPPPGFGSGPTLEVPPGHNPWGIPPPDPHSAPPAPSLEGLPRPTTIDAPALDASALLTGAKRDRPESTMRELSEVDLSKTPLPGADSLELDMPEAPPAPEPAPQPQPSLALDLPSSSPAPALVDDAGSWYESSIAPASAPARSSPRQPAAPPKEPDSKRRAFLRGAAIIGGLVIIRQITVWVGDREASEPDPPAPLARPEPEPVPLPEPAAPPLDPSPRPPLRKRAEIEKASPPPTPPPKKAEKVRMVKLRADPGPATFRRVDTGETLCENKYHCSVPVDVDIKVTKAKHRPFVVTGDALFDRRHSGKMRVVLQPR